MHSGSKGSVFEGDKARRKYFTKTQRRKKLRFEMDLFKFSSGHKSFGARGCWEREEEGGG